MKKVWIVEDVTDYEKPRLIELFEDEDDAFAYARLHMTYGIRRDKSIFMFDRREVRVYARSVQPKQPKEA